MTDLPTSIIINHIFLPIRYFTAIFSFYEALFMLLLEDLRVEEEGGREELRRRCTNSKSFFFQKSKRKEVFYSHAQKVAVKL